MTDVTLEDIMEPEASTAGTATVEVVSETAPVLVEEELLVEDVSIDGMCGVY